MAFDYNLPAELFMPKRKGTGGGRGPIGYRRFATAAEAIRFAVENFPAVNHRAPGCRSEMSASIAMRFADYMRARIIRFGVTCPVKTIELGEGYDDEGRSKACRGSRTSVAKADKAHVAGSA
jgi:hypothetical protein